YKTQTGIGFCLGGGSAFHACVKRGFPSFYLRDSVFGARVPTNQDRFGIRGQKRRSESNCEREQSSKSDGEMKYWYAVHTKSACEASACASLDRLGVEVFLPMMRERKMLYGKCRSTASPLFARYLFAKFDVSSQLRAVTYARGVKQ